MSTQKGYERKEKIEVHKLLPVLRAANEEAVNTDKKWWKNKKKIIINGDSIKVNSTRMRCFVYKGTSCARCGVEGTFFAKERGVKEASKGFRNWHLNLYAKVKGGERLMTMDHVIPKSKGGKNTLENSQTLCVNCNQSKGDKIPRVTRPQRAESIFT